MVLFETYEDYYEFRRMFFTLRFIPFENSSNPICKKYINNLSSKDTGTKINFNNSILYKQSYFEIENKYLSKVNLNCICYYLGGFNFRQLKGEFKIFNETYYIKKGDNINSTEDCKKGDTNNLIEYSIADATGIVAMCPLKNCGYYKIIAFKESIKNADWFISDENKVFCMDLVEYMVDNNYTIVHKVNDNLIEYKGEQLFMNYEPIEDIVYLFVSIMLLLFSDVKDMSNDFITFVKGFIAHAERRLTINPNLINDYKNKINLPNYYFVSTSDIIFNDYKNRYGKYKYYELQKNLSIEFDNLPNYPSVGVKIIKDINESLKANDKNVHSAFINRHLSMCVLSAKCYGFPLIGNQFCTNKLLDSLKQSAKYKINELPGYNDNEDISYSELSNVSCGDIVTFTEDCGISLENFGFYMRYEKNIYDISKKKLFSLDNFKEMLFNAFWSLKVMHENNIVHCDIHQGNIVITYSNYKYNIDKNNVFIYYTEKDKVWKLKKSTFSLSIIDFGESLLLFKNNKDQSKFLNSLDKETYNDFYYDFNFDTLKNRSIEYLKNIIDSSGNVNINISDINIENLNDEQRINFCKLIDLKKLVVSLIEFLKEEIKNDELLKDKKKYRSKEDLRLFYKLLDVDCLEIDENVLVLLQKIYNIIDTNINNTKEFSISNFNDTNITKIYEDILSTFDCVDNIYEEYNEYTELYKSDNEMINLSKFMLNMLNIKNYKIIN